jgi:phage terminase small subunit
MCEGCFWNMKSRCEVITEPGFIHKKRGECWAKATPERGLQINAEIMQLQHDIHKKTARAN